VSTGAVPPEEIAAARTAAGLFDYDTRGKLAVSGSDRIAFLQGMVTSDVAGLAVGGGQRSAIVNAGGKMIANLLLLRLPEEVLLETGEGRAPAAAAALARFVVTEDVSIADVTPERAILSLQGPRSEPILRAALPRLSSVPVEKYGAARTDSDAGPLVVVRHHRFAAPGFDLWVSAGRANALRASLLAAGSRLGLLPCGPAARDALRIAAGRPTWGYVGQEVLSRIHHLGHVNRTLVRVEPQADPAAELPLPLYDSRREAGVLTSLARIPGEPRPIGLAIVRRESAAPGTRLELRGPSPIPVSIVDAVG
jgi:glycine cleavage system aminomethyltransferase T